MNSGPYRVTISGEYVGRGEDAAVQIIEKLFKDEKITIERHVKVHKLCMLSEIYSDFVYGERQQKESIDILLTLFDQRKTVVVRVQDKRHKSRGMAKIDSNQAKRLLDSGVVDDIIDLHEDDCKHLFKNQINNMSVEELKDGFKEKGVRPLHATDWD